MLRNLIANNPEIFRQVTSEQTMSPMQQSSGRIPLRFNGLNMGSDLIKQVTQQSFFNTNEDEEESSNKITNDG
jgi:hypothetical protein